MVRNGDITIAGYPKAVAGVLAERARKGERLDLTVYSGASPDEEFDSELARVGAFRARMPYQTNKDLRNAINAGEVSYHDVPPGQMPVWVKNKFLRPVDVAIIEATAMDENGNIIPTTSVGTSDIYAECAKQVIIEVNTYVPACMEGVHDVYSPACPPCKEQRKPPKQAVMPALGAYPVFRTVPRNGIPVFIPSIPLASSVSSRPYNSNPEICRIPSHQRKD